MTEQRRWTIYVCGCGAVGANPSFEANRHCCEPHKRSDGFHDAQPIQVQPVADQAERFATPADLADDDVADEPDDSPRQMFQANESGQAEGRIAELEAEVNELREALQRIADDPGYWGDVARAALSTKGSEE